jgi:hypothetical protein
MTDESLRTQTQPVNPPGAPGHAAPLRPWLWAPWIAAAGLALVCAWLLLAYVAAYGDLVSLRSQEALRAVENKALQQQIDAERILSSQRAADLLDELHARDEPGPGQIVPLAAPQAAGLPPTAFVVLNANRQDAELVLAGIPALPADKDYQLWMADSENVVAVSVAVFTVDSMSGGYRVPFKVGQLRANSSFAVSVERKGGAASRQGPIVLSSR